MESSESCHASAAVTILQEVARSAIFTDTWLKYTFILNCNIKNVRKRVWYSMYNTCIIYEIINICNMLMLKEYDQKQTSFIICSGATYDWNTTHL